MKRRILTNLRFSQGLLMTALLVFGKLHAQDYAEATRSLTGKSGYEAARFSIAVVDAATDELLFDLDAGKALIPASSTKVLTARAALETLGSTYRIETRITSEASVVDGILQGDLCVLGAGDPTLGSRQFNDESVLDEWAALLYAKGIRQVQGRLIVHDPYAEVPPLAGSTAIEDGGNYYGAGAYGVNIFDNRFELVLQSDAEEGSLVRVHSSSAYDPSIQYVSHVTASSRQADLAYIYGQPFSREMHIYGSIPKGRDSFPIKAAMPHPPTALLMAFEKALRKAGIRVEGKKELVTLAAGELDNQKVLHLHASPSLGEIVGKCLIHSDNLYASALMNLLRLFDRSEASPIERILLDHGQSIAGLNCPDGSGLSRANTVTARQLAWACKRMTDPNNDAALQGGLKQLEGQPVFIKTGYLGGARSVCGRVFLPNGRMRTFAVIVNAYDRTPSQVKQDLLTWVRKCFF